MRLALHLVEGLLRVALLYPFLARPARQGQRQRWSQRMLALLGIEVQTKGQALAAGSLLVANHISWLDIFVINALTPAAFVAKADLRGWPLLGRLAARNDTIFLQRGNRSHARIVNEQITALLLDGNLVAVFPEGTTTDGSAVLNFHSALLQPAIAAGRPIQPLALRYETPDGQRCRAPAYDGDVTLLQCIAAITATPHLIARCTALAPLSSDSGATRRELAAAAHAAIAANVSGRGHPGLR